MRCIFDSRKPSRTGQLVVPSSLLAMTDARETLWVVSIVVMLMDGQDAGGRIHDGDFSRTCPPYDPVVPAGTPERERGNASVEASRKDKIVDSHGRL